LEEVDGENEPGFIADFDEEALHSNERSIYDLDAIPGAQEGPWDGGSSGIDNAAYAFYLFVFNGLRDSSETHDGIHAWGGENGHAIRSIKVRKEVAGEQGGIDLFHPVGVLSNLDVGGKKD
jgi:hypothetical protein